MPSHEKNTRGLVYRCPECGWQGEKTWTADHYAKNHTRLEDAPYCCYVCKFKAGSDYQLARHLKQPKHLKELEKKGKKEDDVVKRRGGTDEIREKFETLTAEESMKYWSERRKKTEKEEKAGESKKTSGETTQKESEKEPERKTKEAEASRRNSIKTVRRNDRDNPRKAQ